MPEGCNLLIIKRLLMGLLRRFAPRNDRKLLKLWVFVQTLISMLIAKYIIQKNLLPDYLFTQLPYYPVSQLPYYLNYQITQLSFHYHFAAPSAIPGSLVFQ